jgi:hypothetical protein
MGGGSRVTSDGPLSAAVIVVGRCGTKDLPRFNNIDDRNKLQGRTRRPVSTGHLGPVWEQGNESRARPRGGKLIRA